MPDMKRFAAALLALLLMQLTALAEGTIPAAPVYSPDTLTVGNTTRLDGHFFTEMWGNATSDYDVRQLLHGLSLAEWNGMESMFDLNPQVVTGSAVTQDAHGNKTYHLSLSHTLFYSDGSHITAADYAFSFLLTVDPVIARLGGNPMHRDYILGCGEYVSGASSVLTGVRVLNDFTLDVTLSADYLPFFYEVGLLECCPYPIQVIAPGCRVADDGTGVRIVNADENVTEPLFTAENLARTLLDDPETGRFGYISHPTVVSGPYTLASFDGVTVEFELNPFFKGNRDGIIPRIPHIVYTVAENETMMDEMAAGNFGLLNKVTRSDAVAAGTELANTGAWRMSTYPRSGLSFINFSCERPIPTSQAVRQALSYCLDKEALTRTYVGDNGMTVDAWYGMGQWMVQVLNGGMPYPVSEPPASAGNELKQQYTSAIAAWKALSMDDIRTYDLNTSRAAVLLNGDGWTLNAEGEAFREGEDEVRYKKMNGQLVPLELTLAYPEGNAIAEALEVYLLPSAAQVGVRILLLPMAMSDILDQLYRRSERTVDMIYLATNFEVLYDPAVHFSHNDDGIPEWSYTGLEDATLFQLADAMRHTEPNDYLTYVQRWLAFQEHFAELVPAIPIYSNMYFDIYRSDLQNYNIVPSVSWSQAIVPAWLGAAPAE